MKYMSRNPLTQTNYLKVMEKVTIIASIRCTNQVNIQFGVKKHSNYTMEHVYDKTKYINNTGKYFC